MHVFSLIKSIKTKITVVFFIHMIIRICVYIKRRRPCCSTTQSTVAQEEDLLGVRRHDRSTALAQHNLAFSELAGLRKPKSGLIMRSEFRLDHVLILPAGLKKRIRASHHEGSVGTRAKGSSAWRPPRIDSWRRESQSWDRKSEDVFIISAVGLLPFYLLYYWG